MKAGKLDELIAVDQAFYEELRKNAEAAESESTTGSPATPEKSKEQEAFDLVSEVNTILPGTFTDLKVVAEIAKHLDEIRAKLDKFKEFKNDRKKKTINANTYRTAIQEIVTLRTTTKQSKRRSKAA